jgi:predicted deacylase
MLLVFYYWYYRQGALGEKLRKNCQGLKVLLVDERSLIGATTLGWVEFMCRYGVEEGQNFDKTWGGLPVVIFFGRQSGKKISAIF